MYKFVIYKGTTLWNQMMEAAGNSNKLLIKYQGKKSGWYADKNIYAIGARKQRKQGPLKPAQDWNGNAIDSHTSSVWMDIQQFINGEEIARIEDWTTAKGRSDEPVIIADLTPCKKTIEIK